MEDQPQAESTNSVEPTGEPVIMQSLCSAPAPLVLNGASFVGCQLVRGHEGNHSVTVNWPS